MSEYGWQKALGTQVKGIGYGGYTIRYGTLRTNGKLEVTHVNKPNWAQTFDSLTRAKRWIDAHPAAY